MDIFFQPSTAMGDSETASTVTKKDGEGDEDAKTTDAAASEAADGSVLTGEDGGPPLGTHAGGWWGSLTTGLLIGELTHWFLGGMAVISDM